jgi:hypothetical protein
MVLLIAENSAMALPEGLRVPLAKTSLENLRVPSRQSIEFIYISTQHISSCACCSRCSWPFQRLLLFPSISISLLPQPQQLRP